ncbi:MAG: hypothetical protein JNL10_17350 [Verrucomicrobiales bacterium]|nr:hypothetical protein [Verrucomicrobiales bacterium]
MTLIDSNVILDLVTADERWLDWSSGHLAEAADSGPVAINPVIFAEGTGIIASDESPEGWPWKEFVFWHHGRSPFPISFKGRS